MLKSVEEVIYREAYLQFVKALSHTHTHFLSLSFSTKNRPFSNFLHLLLLRLELPFPSRTTTQFSTFIE